MAVLDENSIVLMEYFGWQNCGGEYWDHPDYPMQQFSAKKALELAREMSRKDMLRNA